jgi:hypothetical protein
MSQVWKDSGIRISEQTDAVLMKNTPSPGNPIPKIPRKIAAVAGRKFRRGPDPRQPVRVSLYCKWCGAGVLRSYGLKPMWAMFAEIPNGTCPCCGGKLGTPQVDDVKVIRKEEE